MANNQPPLTHPATNPDGTCDDERCPCHEFAQMPMTTTNSGDLDYWRRITQEANARNGYDSPALRRTRSIVHHAKMVEEQVRRERGNCVECGHSNVNLRGHCRETVTVPNSCRVGYCGCKCIFPDTAQGDQITGQIAPSSFDHVWDAAPESMRRVTEIEAAELFYYAGRRDRETELLAEMNETLRGVVERIGAERVK